MQRWHLLLGVAILFGAGGPTVRAQTIDLTNASVYAPPGLNNAEKHAVAMLIDEVAARSRVRWMTKEGPPVANFPAIAVVTAAIRNRSNPAGLLERPIPPEGYRIDTSTTEKGKIIWVIGSDSRGVLFGVGASSARCP